ncbi:hypothetical protein B224_2609 [Aeromonas media WS]|nr:hypothetical protein B224_2609 [Aeromonas media WS]
MHSACWHQPPTLRPPAPDIAIMGMTSHSKKSANQNKSPIYHQKSNLNSA